MENKQQKIERLEQEDAELKCSVDFKTCSIKKQREITCKVFKISQQLRKLGAYNTKEYRQAMAEVKKYIDEYNAKLEDKMKKSRQKTKVTKRKRRKRKENTVHFLHDEKLGILCAILHDD